MTLDLEDLHAVDLHDHRCQLPVAAISMMMTAQPSFSSVGSS